MLDDFSYIYNVYVSGSTNIDEIQLLKGRSVFILVIIFCVYHSSTQTAHV